MYSVLKTVHSYWAYLVLLIVVLAAVNAIVGFVSKKEFRAKDLRISLFGLITTHIQLVLGAILYFVSPNGLSSLQNSSIGEMSKGARLLALEHPVGMVLMIVLITIGWSSHKRQTTAKKKFGKIALFYGLALVIAAKMIPWATWM